METATAVTTATDRRLRRGGEMVRWVAPALSLALYALACAAPALHLGQVPREPRWGSGPDSVMAGWETLLLGWLAVFSLLPAWFANPVLACSLVCVGLRWWRGAAVLALVALLLAATLLLFNRLHVPANEGGTADFILRRPLIGCYLWLGSMLVAGFGALLGVALDAAALQRRAA